MDTRAADLLRRARALVHGGWSQRADARAGDGTAVQPWDAAAVSWSLLGALVAALEEQTERGRDLPLDQLATALDALAYFIDDDSLAAWNDDPSRTKDAVTAALDKAANTVAKIPANGR